jgi:hypothetical protein
MHLRLACRCSVGSDPMRPKTSKDIQRQSTELETIC